MWLKDYVSLSVLNLDCFFPILLSFLPANLPQYILVVYNFCARPIASSDFLLFLYGKVKHSDNELCLQIDEITHIMVLQLIMLHPAVFQIYAKIIIVIIQMNKYACAQIQQ